MRPALREKASGGARLCTAFRLGVPDAGTTSAPPGRDAAHNAGKTLSTATPRACGQQRVSGGARTRHMRVLRRTHVAAASRLQSSQRLLAARRAAQPSGGARVQRRARSPPQTQLRHYCGNEKRAPGVAQRRVQPNCRCACTAALPCQYAARHAARVTRPGGRTSLTARVEPREVWRKQWRRRGGAAAFAPLHARAAPCGAAQRAAQRLRVPVAALRKRGPSVNVSQPHASRAAAAPRCALTARSAAAARPA